MSCRSVSGDIHQWSDIRSQNNVILYLNNDNQTCNVVSLQVVLIRPQTRDLSSHTPGSLYNELIRCYCQHIIFVHIKHIALKFIQSQ